MGPPRTLVLCLAQTIKKPRNLCVKLDTLIVCAYWSRSLFREFITVLYDMRMKTLITLLLACCFGSAMAQSNLPTCEGARAAWTDCFGSHTFASGNKYVGEYKDGKRNGQFIVTYASGDKYVGEYKDGKRNGQGTYTFADGAKYVGEYKDGKYNGQGTYTATNGDKFVGEHKRGLRNGQGTHTFANGNKYVGEYKDNKRNGQFIVTYANGSKYVGEFRGNQKNGRGTNTFANGNKYVGEYKDGKRNGQFIVTYANGSKYVGEYKDDKKNGLGIKYLANGNVDQSGIWKDGNLVQSKFIDVATFTRIPNLSNSASNQAQRRKPEEQAKQDQAENEALATALNSALAKAARKQKELEAQLAAAQQQTQVKPTAPIGPRLSVHAIVIGNGAYQGSGRLDNPINDARAISAKLKSMGFKVTTIENADRTKLVSSLVKFGASAVDSDLTLFFYAGHGVQISGKNYMLPTDTNLNQIGGVELHGISLNSVVERFLPGKTKLVFLDACRDNPLLQVASRSVSRGLAPISVSQGTLISYATKDGSVAADGSGKNSPFTKALLQHIDSPDDIAVVLRRVRDQVMRETGGQQQPWEYGSLSGGSLILSAIRAK